MAPFKNYEFGQGGVDVDTDPVHLPNNKLLKSQNAIRDPLGVKGGLKNRPGFAKFNSSAAAGSLLGGISGSGVTPVDARTLIIAQKDAGADEEWWSSSDLFATSAQVTGLGAWQDPTAYMSTLEGTARMGVFFNGQLFYASASYTSGTTSPPIRVYNGADDRELTKLLPATTKGIVAMIAQKGYMYVLTLDSGTSDADFIGRVFRMSETGEFLQIGTALATGGVPTALAVQNGIIYVGWSRLTVTNEARVYKINPLDETSWTLDATMDADDYMITDLASFQGLLYATTKNGGAATKGKVKKRSVAGSWSTVDSTTANTGEYNGLAEFNGSLYASSRVYNSGATTAVIRSSADGTTWATAYSGSNATGVGRLTVLGLRLFSMGGTGVLHTLDGSSFTSATPSAGGNIDGAIGLLIRTGAAQWFVPDAQQADEPVSDLNPVSVSVGLQDFDDFTLRKRGWYYSIAGTNVETAGFGTVGSTGATSNGDAIAESRYIEFRDGGSAGANMGIIITANKPTAARFLPKFRATIRTHDANQTEYITWTGLFNQTAASDTDTLTATAVAFRYHKPAGAASADSGNFQLVVHNGTTQEADVDTGMAVVGGLASGGVSYRMEIEFTSSTVFVWTITRLDTNAVVTGTGSFTGPVADTLGPGFWGTDVNGGVKVILLNSIYLDWN